MTSTNADHVADSQSDPEADAPTQLVWSSTEDDYTPKGVESPMRIDRQRVKTAEFIEWFAEGPEVKVLLVGPWPDPSPTDESPIPMPWPPPLQDPMAGFWGLPGYDPEYDAQFDIDQEQVDARRTLAFTAYALMQAAASHRADAAVIEQLATCAYYEAIDVVLQIVRD